LYEKFIYKPNWFLGKEVIILAFGFPVIELARQKTLEKPDVYVRLHRRNTVTKKWAWQW